MGERIEIKSRIAYYLGIAGAVIILSYLFTGFTNPVRLEGAPIYLLLDFFTAITGGNMITGMIFSVVVIGVLMILPGILVFNFMGISQDQTDAMQKEFDYKKRNRKRLF